MSLRARLTGKSQPLAPTDDLLLLHAMFLMAGADGSFDAEETALITGLAETVPELKSLGAPELQMRIIQAKQLVKSYPSPRASVVELSKLSSPRLKQKAYVLAADVALASGEVDEHEDQMLEAMRQALEVDDATATRILDVLVLKYVP